MKLTSKLVLAFLIVSLFSIGAIAVSTRILTNREFDKFISQRYEENISTQLGDYYGQNHTWNGVETLFSRERFNSPKNRPLFFSIADIGGSIVVAGPNYRAGETVNAETLASGKEIKSEEKVVGYLLLDNPPDRNPMEDEFIHRIGETIFFSAIVTVALAFVFGAIISSAIARPLRELTEATREIASGKFNRQVKVRSRDEIGELAQSFNKMNDDLARSLNLRRQMTADIAHELRTPLSLIIGHAEAVHDGVLPPTRENFEIIREEAERLEKLVNDLRTLSLADAGELTMNFQRVDVNQLLKDIRSHYLIPFANKPATLDLETTDAPLEATLDPIRFSQALTNILENALRYAPEGGRALISAKQVGDEIEISIADNGEGVTPEEAARLFDRFYRADESRTRDEGGSGLGLAITKSIIEMHKGRIWAESEKGKGLKMIIRIASAEA